MAESFHGLIEGKEYNLNIGSSFKKKQNDGIYHTVRYDFKPASVDSTKASELTVGSNNDVTVKVPHIQESGSTVFRGSKRPCAKECLLIIDKDTGEVTLEKLASNIQLKKIRSANQAITKTVSQQSQPVAKVSSKPSVHKQRVASKGDKDNIAGKPDIEPRKKEKKHKEKTSEKLSNISKSIGPSAGSTKPVQKSSESSGSPSSPGSDSESSSSASDSDSDQDDLETREQAKALDAALMQEHGDTTGNRNLIDDDLRLSDSDSD